MPDNEIKIIGLVFSVLFGLLFGSFATMASYRIPKGDDIIYQRSHCTNCNHSLGFTDLIPVFSWLFNMGKCHYCSVRVSARYPLIEIIMATMFGIIFLKFGLSPAGFILSGLSVCLVIISVTDIEQHVMPKLVQIWMLTLGLAYSYLTKEQDIYNLLAPPLAAIIIALIIKHGMNLLNKKITFGKDYVIFFAIAGLFLNAETFAKFVIYFFAASLLTYFLLRKKLPVFSPAICLALFVSIIYP